MNAVLYSCTPLAVRFDTNVGRGAQEIAGDAWGLGPASGTKGAVKQCDWARPQVSLPLPGRESSVLRTEAMGCAM